MLTTLRNVEVNKKAVFGSDVEGDGSSLIDTFFLGETSEDYSDQFCRYALPIKMSDIIDQVKSSDGSTSIVEYFVKHRAQLGKTNPIFKNLKQRFLIVKLDFTDVELNDDELEPIWKAIDDRIDTDLLTKQSNEEDKVDAENARLVAIVDRLNKETSTNNNEVNILIDGQWRNFKTCIYKANSYSHIIEDGHTAKRIPIILVYKLIENVPVNDPKVHRESNVKAKKAPAPAAQPSPKETDISDYRKSHNDPAPFSIEDKRKLSKLTSIAAPSKGSSAKQSVPKKDIPVPEQKGCCCTIF